MNYLQCMVEKREAKINQKQMRIHNKIPNPYLIVKQNKM
jgi:hypothetical protein